MNQTSPAVVAQAILNGPPKGKVTELFDSLDLATAQRIVNSRVDKQAEINLKYLKGDHWQASKGWPGPRTGAGEEAISSAMMAAIEASFVSRNAIGEVTGRHVAGVLGRTVHWKFTVKRELKEETIKDDATQVERVVKEQPTEQEQALIDEAEAALVSWWDKREIGEVLQKMEAAVLNAKRAAMRIYVPPDLRDSAGNLPPGDLSQTLDYIYLQHLGTNDDSLDIQFPSATVYTQKTSRRQIGIYTYMLRDELIDTQGDDGSKQNNDRAELTYLDDAGQTVLRIIDKTGNIDQPITLPLGGRLFMYEITRPWLISPQVVSQQKLLNMAMTMKQRNAVLGGFLERIFSNVDWPGKWVPDSTKKSGQRFEPEPIKIGGGVATNITSLPVEDDKGHVTYLQPAVQYRDPVSPATFIETEDSAYLAILQECNQLHYALAGDAVVSGESRKQAREAFKQDLQLSAGKVQAVVRWALETILAMAAIFAGREGDFDGLRVYAQAKIDSGPVSADDMRVAAEMKDDDLWSVETAMSATGIEDVDAENSRKEKERADRAALDAANLAAAQQLMAEQGQPAPNAVGAPDQQGQPPTNPPVTTQAQIGRKA